MNNPIVESAVVSFDLTQITVLGSGFSPHNEAPQVRFNGSSLAVVSFSDTQFVAALPSGLSPATYLLEVSTQDPFEKVEEFDVTIGVAGPQGPTGPQGLQGLIGVTGAIGPQGPSGPGGLAISFVFSVDSNSQQSEQNSDFIAYADFKATLGAVNFNGTIFYYLGGASTLHIIALSSDGRSVYFFEESPQGQPLTFEQDFPTAVLIPAPATNLPPSVVPNLLRHWSVGSYADFVAFLRAFKFNGQVFYYDVQALSPSNGGAAFYNFQVYAIDSSSLYTYAVLTVPGAPNPLPSTFSTDFPNAVQWAANWPVDNSNTIYSGHTINGI